MRDTDERLALMHRRTRELRHERDGTRLIIRGGSLMALLVALAVSVAGYSGEAVSVSRYAGATLLDESAGGYILVAIIAFMVGIGIAAFLIRRTRSKAKTDEKEKKDDEV